MRCKPMPSKLIGYFIIPRKTLCLQLLHFKTITIFLGFTFELCLTNCENMKSAFALWLKMWARLALKKTISLGNKSSFSALG